ncbi:Predicted dithiol-disulfide isomerase, DsbA family [Paenibacillus sp. UNCCL117]|uniref:DsbA family oxidoreductase n=1 Tax=unclassified Paenibacillus TaxID=185978 RepID=UPI00088BBF4D|nr:MULTISPECIES: DsbA family oxidoreductase [unclassified Paenibacillus]SDD14614.1 Predicted dithiol-disulfide isomerase, DsbA family [Paenibacillus sp. cl123]SFW34261.1 Predicted dithiol-disulfide isomerase, DsbA family [Paenibacillus sp. UNCCL117]
MIQIDIYSDMVCPWCRIGKSNLMKALAAWKDGDQATVSYRAYQLDPELPPEGKPFQEAMAKKMGGVHQIAQATDQVTRAGAAAGVPFRFDRVTRMPNTKLAHRLTALLPSDKQGPWVDAVMKAYFEEGQDIALREVLLSLASELGEDAEALGRRLDLGEGETQVKDDQQQAARMGVTGVPFFVFNNKYALSGAYPPDQIVKVLEQTAAEAAD